MSVEMVIEVADSQMAQTVQRVLESYQARLRGRIARTRRRLAVFEDRYGVSTTRFMENMAAEDLQGGDLEYVEWPGEAKLRAGLESELKELENARCRW